MTEITQQTIKQALDHNDKEAWDLIETQLNRHFPDQKHTVKEFLDGVHQIATSDNYQTYEDLRDELASSVGTVNIFETQVISLNPENYPGPKQEIQNAYFQIIYDDLDNQRVFAVLEKVQHTGREETDFSDFEMDNTPFWEYVEFISDEYDPIELLIEELNNAVNKGFDIVRLSDDTDTIYVDESQEGLFNEIERTIDKNRNFNAPYILEDYDVYYVKLDDIEGPLHDAMMIQDTDIMELVFSNISKYDITIRAIVSRSNRTQQVAVTTVKDGYGLFLKTEEHFVFFE